ncbi:hypothetical protein HRI_000630800 [Hibiscus trionum]|uniref:Uncharacterized protein n=1 Tax=Hibiscus trionum TaxID=183268 RepID=A0A9W7H210_HIBTR|nr:hypothetical protein HRI_000630800 [Hibiscus trionum]
MDEEKGTLNNPGAGTIGVTEKKMKKNLSQDIADGLEQCLEENKGDHTKCKDKFEAFKSSSKSKPIRLRSGSLIDV